ncbi:MAG: hypothetical protein IPL99_12190 [Candidatus Competibacteraceae bacterium]|nr:hypothetical protein [Candidatus Competibacteraceae bacterium]
MFEWLKQPWFWGAISAVAAVLGFLFTHLIGKRRFRYWRLQRVLDAERSFYSAIAAPRQGGSEPLAEGITQRYVASVDQGLVGVSQLSPTTPREAKEQLRRLISNLRATHQTLVTAIEPFSLADAKQFFEGFEGFSQKLQTLYYGGNIPHDARTHCGEIKEVISELDRQLQGWRDISSLRYLVENDRDVIVPMMVEVLERAQTEMLLIAQSIRGGNLTKAVILKERFWFEAKSFYIQLTASLSKMGSLVTRL